MEAPASTIIAIGADEDTRRGFRGRGITWSMHTLNIIQGYSELLLLDTLPEDERCELLRAIRRASAQASVVTAGLPTAS